MIIFGLILMAFGAGPAFTGRMVVGAEGEPPTVIEGPAVVRTGIGMMTAGVALIVGSVIVVAAG